MLDRTLGRKYFTNFMFNRVRGDCILSYQNCTFMKKLLYCAAALSAVLFAGSCQRENLEPVVNGGVTYTISLPETVQTKGSNGYAEYDLYYEVYKTADPAELATATPLFEKTEPMTGNTTTVVLDLLNDQDYTILFWANKTGVDYFDLADLRKVTVKQAASNNNDRDAFCGMDQLVNFDAATGKTVTLTRPFAQLNIATLVTTTAGYDVTPLNSFVRVSDIPVTYNVFDGAVSGETSVEFDKNAVPFEKTVTVNSVDYDLVAMNYILVPEGNVTVYYEIETVNGTVNNTINNVPVKKNYRTNIVGNLLTSNATYTVDLQPGFLGGEGEAHVEVINEGVVKNINGDYEVSNANGLAYSINNLMADGGNFYLTAAEYDMTGLAVNSLAIASGVTLNIYGETPVVTRSATTIGGATIIGLGNLINTIAEGANVSISGIDLADKGSVLVNSNNGTLVVSDSEADKVVGEGNAPVPADAVKDLATLNAALDSDVKVITIAADLKADAVVLIDRSVVINGNGHTFTTSANRAFRLTTSDTEVTINDLDIVSTAVMVYPSDVRGVSIDGSLSNVSLTLNECTVDFTDETTNDWTYAVNISGNGTGHKVNVIGGTYEGANVINVHGAKNTVTVKNATLTSLYPFNEVYWGACIWVLQNQESSVYAEGNTFEAYNAMAFNLGTGTTLIEKDNVDNTMFYYKKDYYVSSTEKLQYAANNVAKNCSIKLYKDLAGDVTIVQRPGIDVVIDGEGLKYDGTITIDGDNRNTGAETLKITNVNFESETPKTFVSAPGTLNGKKERYSHNVTVENCTFYTPVYTEEAGAISTTQTYHFAVKNCSVENMHSILQVQSCDNDVTVENVTVTNCKNGISFGNTAFPTLKGAEINVKAYGVRTDADANRGELVIENSNITAETPIFVRKVTSQNKEYIADFNKNVTLNFTGKYAAVFTNGTDDLNALAAPTGLYKFFGANDLPVYPRDFAVSTVEDLKTANTFEGTVYVVNDITVSTKWDFKKNGGLFVKPVTIDGMGHTIKFAGEIYNGNGNYAFEFEKAAVVKNLTIDLSETPSTLTTAVSAKSSISVDNSSFIGNLNANSRYGIIFGQGAAHTDNKIDMTVSIKNSTFTDWKRRGISDNEAARDFKSVVIEGNTCTNAHVYVSAYDSMVFTGNVMNNSLANLTSYTSALTAKVTATGNTLFDSEYNIIGSSSKKFSIANVEAQEGFTVYAE